MKKTIIQKLKKYSLAAGAVLAVTSSANAQVLYKEINQTLTMYQD